jgi:hypothetical protein
MNRLRASRLRFYAAFYLLAASLALGGSHAEASALEPPEGPVDPKVLWTLDTGG